MALSRIDDIAARQAIDATRAFREFIRVRRELDLLRGSLFWKEVGDYEYLAHKERGTLRYRGARSPLTEAQFLEFTSRKAQLKARCESLKKTVDTHQRMNKAVQAGAVPTEIVDVLTLIERHGFTSHSLIVGASALYGFAQSSGINLRASVAEERSAQTVESTPTSLRILIRRPEQHSPMALSLLRKAMSKFAHLEEHSPKRSEWLDLVLRFPGQEPDHRRIRSSRSASRFGGKAVKAPGDSLTGRTVDRLWSAPARDRRLAQFLDHVPSFEQVIVGKNGTMALMRTVDPKVFVIWGRTAHATAASADPDVELALPIRVVEEMIDSSMVASRLDDAASAAISLQIQGMADEGIDADDRAGWALAALALLTAR